MPLKPNEDTAARRGCPASGQGIVSVTSRTAPESQSICEEGASTCSVAGTMPWAMAVTILMTPAAPAAAWVCPMLDFTDPSSSGRSVSRPCP